MNIKVNFTNGSFYWKNKVLTSAAQAADVLSDPRFIAKIRAWGRFDFCEETPEQVACVFETAGDVTVRVGFYSKWLTRAIAYEDDYGVHFNTRKESRGAGGPGDLAHELAHQLGFSHNGNAAAGNENTVPYRIGTWVEEWLANPLAVPAPKVAVESLTV